MHEVGGVSHDATSAVVAFFAIAGTSLKAHWCLIVVLGMGKAYNVNMSAYTLSLVGMLRADSHSLLETEYGAVLLWCSNAEVRWLQGEISRLSSRDAL